MLLCIADYKHAADKVIAIDLVTAAAVRLTQLHTTRP